MVSSCSGVGPGSARLFAEARELIALNTSIVASLWQFSFRLLAQAAPFANGANAESGCFRAAAIMGWRNYHEASRLGAQPCEASMIPKLDRRTLFGAVVIGAA